MKNILAILSILILTFNAVGQFDSLYWQNGNVKQIREYYKYNKYNIKAYHSNGSLNYAGHCSLLSGTEYSMTVEAAFDKNGDITVEEGNGILLCYDDDLKLLSTTNFRNKVRFSEYIEYYSSGTIKIKGSYGGLNGVLDKHKQGIWQFYSENGELLEERKYVNGNEYFWNYWLNGTQILINGNGLLKMYYDSGDLKAEGNIKDSKKWGVWNEFSPKNSYVTVLNYTGWTGNYSTNISFRMELINSIDSNKIEIGKNGTGYRLSYRNDGTLKVKAHFVNNSLDSLFLFYKNGNPFEKKSAINLTQTINEAFYPNKVRAFQRVSSNERKYWDWFGNLNEEIVNTEVQGSDDSYKETTTFYYPNGTRREISECIITTTFDQSTGFMEAEYVCEKTEWDESGNKINEQ